MKKASVSEHGIKATVQIADFDGDPDFVKILVWIDPPSRGIDKLAYSRVQRVPGTRKKPAA